MSEELAKDPGSIALAPKKIDRKHLRNLPKKIMDTNWKIYYKFTVGRIPQDEIASMMEIRRSHVERAISWCRTRVSVYNSSELLNDAIDAVRGNIRDLREKMESLDVMKVPHHARLYASLVTAVQSYDKMEFELKRLFEMKQETNFSFSFHEHLPQPAVSDRLQPHFTAAVLRSSG